MHKKPRSPGLGREALVLAAYNYGPALRLVIHQTATACGRTLQAADVEDLLQETYLALWLGGEVAEPAAATGYASRTARHVTVDAVRASLARKRGAGQVTDLRDGDSLVSCEPTPEGLLIARSAVTARLALCRSRLGTAFAPFYLACVLGFTSRETAERLGRTQNAVDSALCRARKRLQAEGLSIRRRPR